MKRSVVFAAIGCIALGAIGWGVLQKVRGPALDGYEVVARPLVQTVVATGRVVAVSRAQVGSPVTGVVVERRVQEGDAVQPGDVLAVLRADDLEAAVREAEAAIGEITDVAGSSFSSESTGAGTLADDEALAALREKLSGGNA